MFTPPPAPIQIIYLVGLAIEYELELTVDPEYPDHVLWETDLLIGFIALRHGACDRGRWLLHAHSKDPARLTLDDADGFPRYYFNDECLCLEMQSWLIARKQLGSMTDMPKRSNG